MENEKSLKELERTVFTDLYNLEVAAYNLTGKVRGNGLDWYEILSQTAIKQGYATKEEQQAFIHAYNVWYARTTD